jgi:hypothetical protein
MILGARLGIGERGAARGELGVADAARAIGLGVLRHGAGALRIAASRFEPVAADVPTTDAVHPARPQNLDSPTTSCCWP